MLENKYNDNAKEFLKKLLIYIDTTIINTVSDDNNENNSRNIISSVLNLRDAIFSELTYDKFTDNINKNFEMKKKEEKDLNQEIVLEKDP